VGRDAQLVQRPMPSDDEMRQEAAWMMKRARILRSSGSMRPSADSIVRVIDLLRRQLCEATFIINYRREVWMGEMSSEHVLHIAEEDAEWHAFLAQRARTAYARLCVLSCVWLSDMLL
jgi:hypothetical protein